MVQIKIIQYSFFWTVQPLFNITLANVNYYKLLSYVSTPFHLMSLKCVDKMKLRNLYKTHQVLPWVPEKSRINFLNSRLQNLCFRPRKCFVTEFGIAVGILCWDWGYMIIKIKVVQQSSFHCLAPLLCKHTINLNLMGPVRFKEIKACYDIL